MSPLRLPCLWHQSPHLSVLCVHSWWHPKVTWLSKLLRSVLNSFLLSWWSPLLHFSHGSSWGLWVPSACSVQLTGRRGETKSITVVDSAVNDPPLSCWECWSPACSVSRTWHLGRAWPPSHVEMLTWLLLLVWSLMLHECSRSLGLCLEFPEHRQVSNGPWSTPRTVVPHHWHCCFATAPESLFLELCFSRQ